MAVEPPLVESVICERSDRPVIVREGLPGDVEAVHARVMDRWKGINDEFRREKGK